MNDINRNITKVITVEDVIKLIGSETDNDKPEIENIKVQNVHSTATLYEGDSEAIFELSAMKSVLSYVVKKFDVSMNEYDTTLMIYVQDEGINTDE